jgi:multidrug efflux system membrane fusion protein
MDEAQPLNPPKRPSRWRRVLIAAAILFVAAIAYRMMGLHHRIAHKMPPQTVGVAPVTTGSMPVTISALGTVTPIATVTVVPQLSGYLTAVGFREGQDVVKGEFLAQIDPRPYEVQLALYEATLSRDLAALGAAQSDLARYMRLAAQDSIAPQQVTDQKFLVAQDKAAVKIDQANIAGARLNLTYTRITAPVSGRVGLRLVDPGNYVTAASSTGIVVITTMKPTTVIFAIPQNELLPVLKRFDAGAKLRVTVFSSGNRTKIATGTLKAISNQMSTTTGTVDLRAVFANTDEALFPNEFTNVTLLVHTLTHAVLAPTPAIQRGAPGTYVYVVNANHTVSLRKVTLGPSNGVETVIASGLTPGETVVVDGIDRLSNGVRVIAEENGRAPRKRPSPRGLPSAARHGT